MDEETDGQKFPGGAQEILGESAGMEKWMHTQMEKYVEKRLEKRSEQRMPKWRLGSLQPAQCHDNNNGIWFNILETSITWLVNGFASTSM